MTGKSIDHIVHTVPDLDAAAADLEALGFTLTPRAQHPWGTANRLAQFRGRNFIELLEVDRPELIFDHQCEASPPEFSFGRFNQDYLRDSLGMSMLVLQGSDSRADVARFKSEGLNTYVPFDFERKATLPDGSEVDVAFSLAFATHADMPRCAFFTCHNKFPQNFWKPDFMEHANGAEGMTAVTLAAPDPETYADFMVRFSGGRVDTERTGEDRVVVATGGHEIRLVHEPEIDQPRFTEITISGEKPGSHLVHGLTVNIVNK